MELDDDYKFAFDCEVNKKFRRTDAIRSSLMHLQARRSKLDYRVFIERQRDLLEEYSTEVDKEDGNNTFIAAAKHFASETSRPIVQEKWSSIFRKRLQEGMPAADIILSLNPNMKPMMDLAKQFKNTYKNRVIQVEPVQSTPKPPGPSHNEFPSSQDSITSVENEPYPSNRIANFIQNKISKSYSCSLHILPSHFLL